MTAKIKFQFAQAIEKTKNMGRNLARPSADEFGKKDVQSVLENLFEQVNRNKEEYIKDINLRRDKYIADSETIRMALTKLITSEEHKNGISDEKAAVLRKIANRRMRLSAPTEDNHDEFQAKEDLLIELERELIGILSGRFKK